jgi:4-hydroxy-4-methyl-2-oxoglutarate aldolase
MIDDPPLLTIKKSFDRVSANKLAELDGAQTGHIVDAMNGRGGLDKAIKANNPARETFIGAAFPCETGPNDNLAITAAVALAQPGDVIMAASDAFDRSAVCGDIVAMLAKNAGCAGMVIDGMTRDLVGLIEVGLPIFSRGITPNSCVKTGPGKVGLPAVVGGVLVSPGDVVMGDKDGVVVIPRAMLDEVIARVKEIRAAESQIIDRVKRENLSRLAYIDGLLSSDKVQYVD